MIITGHAYKHYLLYLKKGHRLSAWQKFLLILVITVVIGMGSISAYFYWQYKKEEPIRLQAAYLDLATTGLVSSQQSLDEMLVAFQVAGIKVKAVDEFKESSAQASGFFVVLDDLNKTISSIDSVKKSVLLQKGRLTETAVPAKFGQINQELNTYYSEMIKVLDETASNQQFIRDLLAILGPDFYLTSLSNDALWRQGNNEQIAAYYKKIKDEAGEALADLNKLNPPVAYLDYWQNQQAYLGLLIQTADNISTVLSKKEQVKEGTATVLEEAYQILIGAKRENEKIATKLLSQKIKLFSTKDNLEKFAAVKIYENSLSAKLADAYARQLQLSSSMKWEFVRKFFLGLEKE